LSQSLIGMEYKYVKSPLMGGCWVSISYRYGILVKKDISEYWVGYQSLIGMEYTKVLSQLRMLSLKCINLL